MSRPLKFPSRARWFLGFLLAIFVGPIGLVVGVSLWLSMTLSPLQNFYLNVYAGSSLGMHQPRSETTIRWAMKTAPGRKPEPMTLEDAVSGKNKTLPVALSDEALTAGWKGVALSAPERVPSSKLAPLLQDIVYEGQGIGRLFLVPAGMELCCLILSFFAFLKVKEAIGWGMYSWWDRAQERRHGRRNKGPILSPHAWLKWPLRRKEIRFRLRLENALLGRLPFGPSYRIPRRLESSHILLMGDTGSGKSSAIRQILRQVEGRGESAIVYDPAMDFVGEFYSPARGDLILNPLDARCPYWGLGDEINRAETATAIAAAFLPEKEYEKAFFTDGPRRILAYLLRSGPQPRDILRMMADPASMELRVKGTPLAALLDLGAPAQRAGVLSSLNMVADCLELLPEWDEAKGKTFATSEWYTERKRWVFLTSSPDYREKILPLHSVWLDLFILRMMGYCEDQNARPVWFVLDELASLNKLPQLHTAVTENRKYGNPVVLGFQGRSQLEKRYGQDAEAMLSQPATKVFFKTSEPRAAKWISEAIGEIEVERLKESRSMGMLSSKKSYAMEIATKPLIIASEISGLEPLHGFIKQENRVVPAHFALAKKRSRQRDFIERKMPATTPRPVLTMPATPAPAELPKRAAAQAALPLFDPPAAKPKEAFVWDESMGID